MAGGPALILVIPNIRPTQRLYEIGLATVRRRSEMLHFRSEKRSGNVMAHQLRELVTMSTKLIPHYLPTKVTGHDTPSLSILVGGEDAGAENY